MKARMLVVLGVCLLLAGDRPRRVKEDEGQYHPIPENAIKVPLPEVQQPDDYSCGAAALMAICSYYGVGPEELDDFKKALGTSSRQGTSVYNMADYAGKLGLEVELIKDGMTLEQLKKHLSKGKPVIVSLQAYAEDPREYDDVKNNRNGHYVVAIGFDAQDNVYFMDPSLTGRRGFLPWKELDKRWHENEGTARKPDVHSHLGVVVGPNRHKAAYFARARKID